MKSYRFLITFVTLGILLFLFTVSASAAYGDVDGDGTVSSYDACVALQTVLELQEPAEDFCDKADMNRDGVVTVSDVRTILLIASDIEKPSPHIYTDWVVTEPATCQKTGKATCYCTHCNEVKEKTIPIAGHTPTKATCTEPSVCDVCKKALSPALGHTVKVGECARCHEYFSGTVVYCDGEKQLAFGDTKEELIAVYGEPFETLTDEEAEIFIYTKNYDSLLIVYLFENTVSKVFTTNKAAVFNDGSTTLKINRNTTAAVGNINFIFYCDDFSQESNNGYALLADDCRFSHRFHESDQNEIAAKITFHITNYLRVLNGKKPLTYSEEAAEVAFTHGKDMATNNYFNHESLDGKHAGARFDAAGIEWCSVGENICALVFDPYTACNGWYNSESHRKIMLSDNFLYYGAAFCYNKDSDYKFYGVQNYYK